MTSSLATLLAVALGTVVLAAPAHAGRRAEVFPVTGNSTITLTGHGYGHGRGLSQYGAEGAARQGLTWQQITEFYYPGTSWGDLRGSIKVLITADTSSDVHVLAQPGLKVTRLNPRTTWDLPTNGARRWRLQPRGASTLVQFKVAIGWQTWRAFGGEGEFSAASKKIALVKGGTTSTYRGRLRSAMPTPGSATRDTVNILSMEQYLRGVVPLEIPATWSPDAVSAQAVAARTYAAAERSHPNAAHYEICDTTACQVYGGYDVEHPAATAAIKATARQGLFYDGRPAFTQFSASSGGWVSAGSAPYLVAKEDPYDGWDGNKFHAWTLEIDDALIEQHYPTIGDLTSIEVATRDDNGEWGGRVRAMTLFGNAGRVDLSGDSLRTELGLKSSWFTFTVTPTSARRG
ncbi:SpoIID/LytB domain-containing protein [Nocardioides currus]|uniref:SpoIID/LytB domain-containing protein n=1 Tax=Nocardioides currus TaxID=2133958 RepID=UPI001402282B|nr:SpoIID/LytB domain-containing protein [Nocardioides currus]